MNIEKFWSKVEKQDGDGCWLWTAGKTAHGYGEANIDGKVHYAHRLAWQLCNGPILDGLYVLHRCDNPPCVRPDHLFLGTQADNMRDCRAKGRMRKVWIALSLYRRAQTHCCRSHPLSGENLYITPKAGKRMCRMCQRMRNAQRHWKNRKRA